MWTKEDNTYNDIRKRSVEDWLSQMEEHEDLAVRGGVAVTRGYIEHLEAEVANLKHENELKNEYMKKAVGKK